MKALAQFLGLLMTVSATSAFASDYKGYDEHTLSLIQSKIEAAANKSYIESAGCVVRLDIEKLNAELAKGPIGLNGGIVAVGGGGSPEGGGSYSEFLSGAILAPTPHAFISPDDVRNRPLPKDVNAAIGVRIAINHGDCRTQAITGELKLYIGTNDNVISTSQFIVK